MTRCLPKLIVRLFTAVTAGRVSLSLQRVPDQGLDNPARNNEFDPGEFASLCAVLVVPIVTELFLALVDLAAVADLHNQHAQNLVLNPADETVVADAILPKLP